MSGDLVPYDPAEIQARRRRFPKLRFAEQRDGFAKRFARIVAREIAAQGQDLTKTGLDVHQEQMERKQARRTGQDGQGNIYIDNRGGQVRINRRRSNEALCWALLLACIVGLIVLASLGSGDGP